MSEIKFTLEQLADRLGGQAEGPHDLVINGVNDLSDAQEGQISFISKEKYLPRLAQTRASAIVTSPAIRVDKPAIIVQRPDLAFIQLLELFAPPPVRPQQGIHPSAVVESALDPTACVGANCYIGPNTTVGPGCVIYPNVYIGPEVTIGRDCVLWPGVVVRERVVIGDRVILQPNATLGADGFGYTLIEGKHVKIAHIGTVVVEDDVEIGASACIDRAKAGATRIGCGTKIDNLVQIGHNVRIGSNSIVVAQVGIAGSSSLGSYVVIGGKVGIADHVAIGDRVVAAAMSGISKDIEPGRTLNGNPAMDVREHWRIQALVRRLPELNKKVAELTKKIHELEQAVHDNQRSDA